MECGHSDVSPPTSQGWHHPQQSGIFFISPSNFSTCSFPRTDPLLFSLFKFQSSIRLALPSPSLESGFPGLGKAVFLGGGCCWGQGSFPEMCHYTVCRATALNHTLRQHVYGVLLIGCDEQASRYLVIGLVWGTRRKKLSQNSKCSGDQPQVQEWGWTWGRGSGWLRC